MMPVSGVRRSWEMARSRFARIFSISASASRFSRSAIISDWMVMWEVMVHRIRVIPLISRKVIG